MRARTLAVLWLVVGIALWCGVFDLHVTRGTREYLQRRAEFELHLVPEPSMSDMMARARHAGILAASIWAALVVAFGWITIWFRGGTRYRHTSRGSL